MEISETLHKIRSDIESGKFKKPYRPGFTGNGKEPYFPRHNPFDLKAEQEDWREHADY